MGEDVTNKRVVLLAHSLKHGGYCVAGKEIVDGLPGGWIRPVSGREHEEVTATQSTMSNGRPAGLSDIVTMNLQSPVPRHHQQENWLLGAGTWEWQKCISWERLAPLLDVDQADGGSPDPGSQTISVTVEFVVPSRFR